MAQQQELARFLTADGFAFHPDDNTLYFLYTNQRSSVFSWQWTGSDFGQKEFIVDGIRPNSSVACIFANDERTVFCISSDSSFRVVKYDEDDEDWLDVEDLPRYWVHSEGQVAGYIGLDGKSYAFFQDSSDRLISLDESWTRTILPVQAAIGTPIANIIVGTSGQNAQVLVFYLNKDKRLHYIEQGIDGKWGNESLFAEVVFEDNLTKIIVIVNEEKKKLEAYVLTANRGIFQVRQGGRRKLWLGKVGEDGKFIPGTDGFRASIAPISNDEPDTRSNGVPSHNVPINVPSHSVPISVPSPSNSVPSSSVPRNDSPQLYNLANIQGDVLPALPKALEYFYYFRIKNLPFFRRVFKEFILEKINTAEEIVNRPPPRINPNKPATFDFPFLGVNVGFSYLGMKLFGLHNDLGDDAYAKGQQQDSKALGDPGTQRGEFWTPDWAGVFKEVIHGVFIIVAYNDAVAKNFVQELENKLLVTPNRSCIHKVYELHAYPRPGPEIFNDHFGYRGGMSNPQVAGVTFKDKMRFPGSPLIPGGVIVMGYDGDLDKDKRPSWAKDGSFMVTRMLDNLVPEFNEFLLLHGPRIFPNLQPEDAALKLGSRLFGRWKNGTPVELSPDHDDPSIAADDNKVNNFVFDLSKRQVRCPFGAHMRKSNPRNDVSPVESAYQHFIRRHNMPYGPEVTDEERDGKGTIFVRGLHLVCYQSSIMRGFKFIQEEWYNNPAFPPKKAVQPGFDPIFGQTGKEGQFVYPYIAGANPYYEEELMTFPQRFIVPRGGEYFFAPSISTLKNYVAA